MSRIDDINNDREIWEAWLKNKVFPEKSRFYFLMNLRLMEISDTLALMYDKMCDKEQNNDKDNC